MTARVDLSVPIDENTTVYPGDPTPRITPACTIEGAGCLVHELRLGSHTGTHLDAPAHVDPTGATIDALDPGLFAGPAVLVDATGAHAREAVGWEVFASVADRLGPGVIALVHTGWSRHWGTPRYLDHPFLSADACSRLLDTGVRSIFLDVLSPDETPAPGAGGDVASQEFPCHHLVAAAGGVIGENLTRIDEVTWPDPFVVALPLRLSGLDGAPTRAMALRLADE